MQAPRAFTSRAFYPLPWAVIASAPKGEGWSHALDGGAVRGSKAFLLVERLRTRLELKRGKEEPGDRVKRKAGLTELNGSEAQVQLSAPRCDGGGGGGAGQSHTAGGGVFPSGSYRLCRLLLLLHRLNGGGGGGGGGSD